MVQSLSEITELFHGTTSNFKSSLEQNINVNFPKANPNPDFGKGFYTTNNYEQAVSMANRKAKLHNMRQQKISSSSNIEIVTPIVMKYRLDMNEKENSILNVQIFDSADSNWGNFILSNRLEQHYGTLNNLQQNIDLVCGPIADGNPNMAIILEELTTKKITASQAIERIKPLLPGNNFILPNQISVHSYEATKMLKLIEILEVGDGRL